MGLIVALGIGAMVSVPAIGFIWALAKLPRSLAVSLLGALSLGLALLMRAMPHRAEGFGMAPQSLNQIVETLCSTPIEIALAIGVVIGLLFYWSETKQGKALSK